MDNSSRAGLSVLCVTPWFPNGPAEGRFNFILHSIRALRRAGHRITVLVTRPWAPAAGWLEGPAGIHARLRREEFELPGDIRLARHLSFPRYAFSEHADFLYKLGTAGSIRELIRARGIQVVHAHTEAAGYSAVAVARERSIPSVVSLHGISTAPQLLDSAGKRERLRLTLAGADRVVLVGEPLRAHYAALAGRGDHFRVVPNGFYLPNVSRNSSRPATGALKFISVSNLDKEKGIGLNLEALAKLSRAWIGDWTYEIVGDGAERKRLEAQTDRLGLRSRVTFHGWLAHDRALRLLADADVFVLPSYREAFGVAYLEAMGTGLLAIGVQGQGAEAFITPGETGLLVRPNDVDSLYEALKSIAADRPRLRRLADAGKRLAHAEFTWDRHAERLLAVFREALGDR